MGFGIVRMVEKGFVILYVNEFWYLLYFVVLGEVVVCDGYVCWVFDYIN